MMPSPEVPLTPTPTRHNPRVQMQANTQLKLGAKAPIYQSTVLNVSLGGALIFSNSQLKEDDLLQIELGAPIFPISRLVRARVAHIVDAPEDVLTILRDKGKADKKKKGYLIGVEFTYIEPDDRQTLERFIKQKFQDEKKRRIIEGDGEEAKHTARERVVYLKPAPVPAWAWGVGLGVGLYEFFSGWFSGVGSWNIAVHVG
ncbi:MAG: PilZ domain-containing protein, partial [Ktedonobacterales bacterium]|nr:PilZ domain-containing protein [Ktedonobacterales bacterium]